MNNVSNLKNFVYFQNQIRLKSYSNNFQHHISLMYSIIELPFTRKEIATLISQCLNNLAVHYYKFDLFACKIFKFLKKFLLKNVNFEYQTNLIIKFIIELNIAKMYFQLGKYAKSFIICEQALRETEQLLIKSLQKEKQNAQLLINGYIILIKSREFCNENDLLYLRDNSKIFKEEIDLKKFKHNAQQLILKYIGIESQLFKKIFQQEKKQYKKELIQPIIQHDSQKVKCLYKLFQSIKERLGKIINQNPSESMFIHKTINYSCSSIHKKCPSGLTSKCESTASLLSKRIQQQKRKSIDDRIESNETTVVKTEKEEKLPKQIESLIEKKLSMYSKRLIFNQSDTQRKEQQQYQNLNIEIIKLQQAKNDQEFQLKQQQLLVTSVQNELQQVKDQVKEKDKVIEEQAIQISQLQQNLCKNNNQQQSIGPNNFNSEYQFSTDQRKIFTQSIIKPIRINDFSLPSEQTPIRLVNSIIDEMQTPHTVKTIKEFSNNRKSPPFSFSFHKQQSDEQIQTKIISQEQSKENNRYIQPWPSSQNNRKSSINDLEDSMTLSIYDSFTQQNISIPICPQEVFSIDIINELNYTLEIQLVSNNPTQKIEDYQILIQANINKERITEMIDINFLNEFLQQTLSHSIVPFSIKNLNSYKLFIQYLLIPFIQVIYEENNYNIAIWPYAQGLIEDQYINFQNKQYKWWIHYIESQKFMIQLNCDQNQQITIDCEFDKETFDKYFILINSDTYDELQILEILERNELQNKRNYFKLQNVKIQNKKLLIEFINQIIKLIENQIKINQIKNIISICLDYQPQGRIIIITENYELYFSNILNSPQKNGQNGITQGYKQITIQNIQSLYQIDFNNLKDDDKLTILKQIKNHYLLFNYSTEIEGNEMQWENQGKICQLDTDYGGTYKIMNGTQYKSPINLTLIGSQNKPEFIQICFFYPQKTCYNTILLSVQETFWKKEIEIGSSIKKKIKYNKQFKIQEDYHLTQVLEHGGWKILENQIGEFQINKIYKLENYINNKTLLLI